MSQTSTPTNEFRTQLRHLKEVFIKSTKKVLKREFSRNPAKHKEYINELTSTYNDILNFIDPRYELLREEDKVQAHAEIKYLRGLLERCYGKLNIEESLPQGYLTRLDATKLEER